MKNELIWLRFRGGDAESIKQAIEDRSEFTAVVSVADVAPQTNQICLVSLQDDESRLSDDGPELSIDFVGVSQLGKWIATGKKQLKVSGVVETGRTDVEVVLERLDGRFRNRVDTNFGEATRLPEKTSEALLGALQGVSQSLRAGMPGIQSLIAELASIRSQAEGGIADIERDAVVTSLEIFGGLRLRKEILRGTTPAQQAATSFLNRLSHYNVREDSQINLDAMSFPGFNFIKPYITSRVDVSNDTGETLSIINCNRQPLEHTLGVDLIYYSHVHQSFVMVQYKRLSAKGDSKPTYYPNSDKNYAGEVDRMNAAEAMLRELEETEPSVASYRLGKETLFLKFCEAKQKSSLDNSMASGFYIPLGLWNAFTAAPASKGPKGGLRIDWESKPRSLNNTEFCNMVRSGWFGSSSAQTDCLKEIIQQTIEADRMLVLAETSPSQNRPDQLRDPFGRYTDEDDPLGWR